MFHLKEVSYLNKKHQSYHGYPFSIPLISSFEKITFDSPITILVGENGTGKSTLLEAIACAIGSIAIGDTDINTDREFEYARKLSKYLNLSWSVKTNKGFFLRAEDFINYMRKLHEIRMDMEQELQEIDNRYTGRTLHAHSLARMPYARSLNEMDNMYNGGLESKSHGESFLEFFSSRFIPNGLYILDEPETPLSPMNQFAFMAMIKEMIKQNSQFIIATHSPIIMAHPDASIYDLNSLPIKKTVYNEIESVKFFRSFLNNPQGFIRHL
ncbi:Predicted ATPase [Proteiniborus ethanoligenes]|uniref:Predicted ATPase n=1 Tax=Proteiniborus ethanoligenes TaxID=415015 RepID=A0A1H3RSY0_9FIRM|nr:AAA family ATPase [Proteiniborus ethanoligenes]SDZ28710.1 Predicted ATPase [Proteiniborus ethanoligenes]